MVASAETVTRAPRVCGELYATRETNPPVVRIANMRLQFATEMLLPAEVAPRVVLTRQRYGRCLELVAFGRRLIVDLIG